MKKSKTKKLAALLLAAMLIQPSIAFAESAKTENAASQTISECNLHQVPRNVCDYAEQSYTDFVEIGRQSPEIFGCEKEELSHVKLLAPFYFCNAEGEIEEPIYYFPVYSEDSERIVMKLIISVSNGQLSVGADTDYVDKLNQIDYSEKDNLVFHKTQDELFVEDTAGKLVLKDISEQETMENQDYTLTEPDDNVFETQRAYTPSFSDYSDSAKIFNLVNPQAEYTSGRCWAACVATLNNYYTGGSVTAANVASRTGISAGATTTQVRNALSTYNMSSVYTSSKLKWSVYGNAIANKKGVVLMLQSTKQYVQNGYTGYIKHMAVGYGYRLSGTTEYMTMWDPARNNRNGGYYTAAYYGSTGTGFTYEVNNVTFNWTESLTCAKK